MMEFDENKAIDFINQALINEGRTAYDEDEVLNIIDMVWDYYDENGLLEVEADPDDDDLDDLESEIVDYVTRMLRKDKKAKVVPEDVPVMVRAELAYEDSIE